MQYVLHTMQRQKIILKNKKNSSSAPGYLLTETNYFYICLVPSVREERMFFYKSDLTYAFDAHLYIEFTGETVPLEEESRCHWEFRCTEEKDKVKIKPYIPEEYRIIKSNSSETKTRHYDIW